MEDLPENGIAFLVDPSRERTWPLAVLILVCGVVGICAGFLLLTNMSMRAGIPPRAVVLLIIIGFLTVALGVGLLLIRAVTGPSRNVRLEVTAGRLRADRYISGDHVVSTYSPDDVQCLFVEDNRLYVLTRKGESPLIGFGEAKVNKAIAGLIAARLWNPETILCAPAARGMDRWMVLPAREGRIS